MQTFRRLSTLAAGALCLSASPSWAQVEDPDELCVGDPCVIQGSHDIADLADLDFGDRTVILVGTLVIGTGDVTILADTFQIANDGQVDGRGFTESGGILTIEAISEVHFEGTSSRAALLMTGCDGGTVDLTVSDGDFTNERPIDMSKTCAEGSGGTITVTEAIGVTSTGRINLTGGVDGFGGELYITAFGDVRLDHLDISGGEGGFVDLSADGAATIGELSADATIRDGFGGDVDITTDGAVVVNGPIQIRGGGAGDGEGGLLNIDAGFEPLMPLTINGEISLRGRSPDSLGGFFTATGSTILINDDILVMGGGGDFGGGGGVDLAGETLVLDTNASIEAEGGEGGGVVLIGTSLLQVDGVINAESTASGNSGGSVDLSGGVVTVSSAVTASARNAAETGGFITVQACTVDVANTATLEARRADGVIQVDSAGLITLAGNIEAGPPGTVLLRHADPDLTPIYDMDDIDPDPVVVQVDGLLAAACPEPGSVLQLAGVIGGLAAVSRRRSRRSRGV